MISAVMADQPVSAGNLSEYRYRAVAGERSLTPDSAPPAPASARSSNDEPFAGGKSQRPAQPEPPTKPSSSMFAAAIISGALSPTPQSMQQLIKRIGSSPIPEESQARLKDLLA